jgi:multidrug efflux pump
LLGLHGVIYGQALTDYVAVLLSIVIWRWKRRKTL